MSKTPTKWETQWCALCGEYVTLGSPHLIPEHPDPHDHAMVSQCCGAEAMADVEGMCGACREWTGFDCGVCGVAQEVA